MSGKASVIGESSKKHKTRPAPAGDGDDYDDPSGDSSPLSTPPASQGASVEKGNGVVPKGQKGPKGKKGKKRAAEGQEESGRGVSPSKRAKVTAKGSYPARRRSSAVNERVLSEEEDVPAGAPTPPHSATPIAGAPTPIEPAPTPPPPGAPTPAPLETTYSHSPSPAQPEPGSGSGPIKGKSRKRDRDSAVEAENSAAARVDGASRPGLKIKLKVSKSKDKDKDAAPLGSSEGATARPSVREVQEKKGKGVKRAPLALDDPPEGRDIPPTAAKSGNKHDGTERDGEGKGKFREKNKVEGEVKGRGKDPDHGLKDSKESKELKESKESKESKNLKARKVSEKQFESESRPREKGKSAKSAAKSDKVKESLDKRRKEKTAESVEQDSKSPSPAPAVTGPSSPAQPADDHDGATAKPPPVKKVRSLPPIEKRAQLDTAGRDSPSLAEKDRTEKDKVETDKMEKDRDKTKTLTPLAEPKAKPKVGAGPGPSASSGPGGGGAKKVNPALKRATTGGTGTPRPKSLLGDAMALLSTPAQAASASKSTPGGSEKKDMPKQRRYGAWTDTWVLTPEEEAMKASQLARREAMKARIAGWKINPVNLQDAKYVYRMDAKATTRVELPKGQNDGRGIFTDGAAGNLVRHFLALKQEREQDRERDRERGASERGEPAHAAEAREGPAHDGQAHAGQGQGHVTRTLEA